MPTELIRRGFAAWAWLFGAVSLALFGQKVAAVRQPGLTPVLEQQAALIAELIGLPN